MLNAIWVAMIFIALICGAATGKLNAVTIGSVTWAGKSVEIAIGLVGIMALWLGLMNVLQHAGLLKTLARALRPIMTRLFPDVPAEHPAMAMIILNVTANMLGLANAATPFGLKAMMELNKLNRHQGTATNAMALFLAINTSNIALIPSGVIGLRAGLGAEQPGSIILTTLAATSVSTLVAIIVALSLQRLPIFAIQESEQATPKADDSPQSDSPDEIDTREAEELMSKNVVGIRTLGPMVVWSSLMTLALCAVGTALYSEALSSGWVQALKTLASDWALVILMVGIVAFGVYKRVQVYDRVVEGGKEGFSVALRIIPYLVAILVAVGMLRESGAIDIMVQALAPVTNLIGMPPETLPMALLRPLTGSGAYGVAAGIMEMYGPDSLIGNIVSTMQGSTETTFYVLALYFGVVNIRRARHTVLTCLICDATGAIAAVWACRILLT